MTNEVNPNQKTLVKTYDELIGKTFESVIAENNRLTFSGNQSYEFYHEQDCCETVYIEEIIGEISDLENSPILIAEEVVSSRDAYQIPKLEEYSIDESYTWTFYKFATIKGYVTVRWLGVSNGYYSESVDFREKEV